MGMATTWSCDQHHVFVFSFPCTLKRTYKIWLRMAQWFLRNASFNFHMYEGCPQNLKFWFCYLLIYNNITLWVCFCVIQLSCVKISPHSVTNEGIYSYNISQYAMSVWPTLTSRTSGQNSTNSLLLLFHWQQRETNRVHSSLYSLITNCIMDKMMIHSRHSA